MGNNLCIVCASGGVGSNNNHLTRCTLAVFHANQTSAESNNDDSYYTVVHSYT